eukprot:GEMP01070556.1.p1 GENE.GEMP01070556.1~~GEMP01070556.1.p1  ORF type:complete len:121 (+),score=29.23 GEMP01070556.1:201-563(+)
MEDYLVSREYWFCPRCKHFVEEEDPAWFETPEGDVVHNPYPDKICGAVLEYRGNTRPPLPPDTFKCLSDGTHESWARQMVKLQPGVEPALREAGLLNEPKKQETIPLQLPTSSETKRRRG